MLVLSHTYLRREMGYSKELQKLEEVSFFRKLLFSQFLSLVAFLAPLITRSLFATAAELQHEPRQLVFNV